MSFIDPLLEQAVDFDVLASLTLWLGFQRNSPARGSLHDIFCMEGREN